MKNVKNLLVLVLCVFASFNMYAQRPVDTQRPLPVDAQIIPNWQTNVTPQTCFCCDGWYSFPSSIAISGPTSLTCLERPKYCINPCPGATVSWSVTNQPNGIASGQGTNCITLNPVQGTSVTITVTISCKDKKVQKQIVVPIKLDPKCKPDFLISLQELANGYQVSATQALPPNTIHLWYLDMVADCPSGATLNNVGWIVINPPSQPQVSNPAFTVGSTGFGFQYSGLVKGKCYRLYHVVYCCGKWIRSYKCFCLATGRMATDMKALNENFVTKEVTVEELPAELRAKLSNGNR